MLSWGVAFGVFHGGGGESTSHAEGCGGESPNSSCHLPSEADTIAYNRLPSAMPNMAPKAAGRSDPGDLRLRCG